MEFSEESIQRILTSHYVSSSKYIVPNAYIFKHDWESDLFVLKKNGYSYEIEIKISKSDYKNDFTSKTHKHDILTTGKYIESKYVVRDKKVVSERCGDVKPHKFMPNKFYYCVPTGMIQKEDVPYYAGLIYCDKFSINIIKEAPFIHKEKLEYEKKLCMKFYYYWRNSQAELAKLKRGNGLLKSC